MLLQLKQCESVPDIQLKCVRATVVLVERWAEKPKGTRMNEMRATGVGTGDEIEQDALDEVRGGRAYNANNTSIVGRPRHQGFTSRADSYNEHVEELYELFYTVPK